MPCPNHLQLCSILCNCLSVASLFCCQSLAYMLSFNTCSYVEFSIANPMELCLTHCSHLFTTCECWLETLFLRHDKLYNICGFCCWYYDWVHTYYDRVHTISSDVYMWQPAQRITLMKPMDRTEIETRQLQKVSFVNVSKLNSQYRIQAVIFWHHFCDSTHVRDFCSTCFVHICTIIKTTSVGDARLSVVGVAGCAWSTHA